MAFAGLDELDAAIAGLEDLTPGTGVQRRDSSDEDIGSPMMRHRNKSLPDLSASLPPPPVVDSYAKAPTTAFLNLAATKSAIGSRPAVGLPPPLIQPVARAQSMPTQEDDDTPPPPPPGGPPVSAPMSIPLKPMPSSFNLNSTYSYELANSANPSSLLYESAPRSPAGSSGNLAALPNSPGGPHVPYTASMAQLRTPVKALKALAQNPLTAPAPAAPTKRLIEVVTSDGSLGKKLDVTDDISGMVCWRH